MVAPTSAVSTHHSRLRDQRKDMSKNKRCEEGRGKLVKILQGFPVQNEARMRAVGAGYAQSRLALPPRQRVERKWNCSESQDQSNLREGAVGGSDKENWATRMSGGATATSQNSTHTSTTNYCRTQILSPSDNLPMTFLVKGNTFEVAFIWLVYQDIDLGCDLLTDHANSRALPLSSRSSASTGLGVLILF